MKTLCTLHIARVSPQESRGEHVPRELLDRIMAVHACWFQLQAKRHCKHQAGPLMITDTSAETDSAKVTHFPTT